MKPSVSRILFTLLVAGAGTILAGTAGTAAAEQKSAKAKNAETVAPYVWREGAQGYQQALAEAKAYNKPLVVYFYTDWCPYCREFNSKLLSTPEVQDHLRHFAVVRINPEKGMEEKRIARQYRIGGYPSFFVHPNSSQQPKPVDRMTLAGPQRRLQTPQEFVETLKQAAVN
ncbi:MAG TPA: thioredoxin family protein [Thermoanaerobaculia bacterium]|nr:thioredoxin family protein [Thermoanaerobaculia bacterium]